MPSVNQSLQYAITDRAIVLERVKEGMRRDIFRALSDLERSLLKDLDQNNPLTATRTAFKQQRLEALLRQTQKTLRSFGNKAQKITRLNLKTILRKENLYLINEVNHQVGVDLLTVAMSPQQLQSVASNILIEGAPSKDWWGRQTADIRTRFSREIRQGMLRGESTAEITRRIRGTRAAGYTDGIMAVPRRNAEALVRTSVQTAANDARLQTYSDNKDVLNGVQWSSTLDTRTTKICMALHGKIWIYDEDGNLKPKGHDKAFPGPTAHWNCRSTQIPVVKSFKELSKDGSVPTGGRPTNYDAAFEKNLRNMGLSQETIAKAKFNARASMDGYAARDMSFDSWLNSRTPGVQNKMLGKGRADLFREGKISVNDLISQRGRPLSLRELSTAPGTPQVATIPNLSVPPFLSGGLGTGGGIGPGGTPTPPPPQRRSEPKPPAPLPPEVPKAGQPQSAIPETRKTLEGSKGKDTRFLNDYTPAIRAKWKEVLDDKTFAWFETLPLSMRKQMNPLKRFTRRRVRSYCLPEASKIQLSKAPIYTEGKRVAAHEFGHWLHFEQKIITRTAVRDDFNALISQARTKYSKTQQGQGIKRIFTETNVISEHRDRIRKLLGITEKDLKIGSTADQQQFFEFADLIGSLSKGAEGYGHSRLYYLKGKYAYMEAMAHISSGTLYGNVYIEKAFPELLEYGRKVLL
jgi:SPP1 gp7 family putative phage head morphogenesis protein